MLIPHLGGLELRPGGPSSASCGKRGRTQKTEFESVMPCALHGSTSIFLCSASPASLWPPHVTQPPRHSIDVAETFEAQLLNPLESFGMVSPSKARVSPASGPAGADASRGVDGSSRSCPRSRTGRLGKRHLSTMS